MLGDATFLLFSVVKTDSFSLPWPLYIRCWKRIKSIPPVVQGKECSLGWAAPSCTQHLDVRLGRWPPFSLFLDVPEPHQFQMYSQQESKGKVFLLVAHPIAPLLHFVLCWARRNTLLHSLHLQLISMITQSAQRSQASLSWLWGLSACLHSPSFS